MGSFWPYAIWNAIEIICSHITRSSLDQSVPDGGNFWISAMLRHACGFKLANDGVDTRTLQHYLGHRNIQHTESQKVEKTF
jgi:site-specific recombinase XerD